MNVSKRRILTRILQAQIKDELMEEIFNFARCDLDPLDLHQA